MLTISNYQVMFIRITSAQHSRDLILYTSNCFESLLHCEYLRVIFTRNIQTRVTESYADCKA